MKQVDYFKTIFQLFLGFLTESAVSELTQRCLQVEDGERAVQDFNKLLNLPAPELVELIQRNADEEDKVKYLNVLLWRQSLGQIPSELRVRYTFTEGYYNWLIHRHMVTNGYDWSSLTGSLAGSVVAQGDATQTYVLQIENQFSAFESSGDLEDASHLAMLLNVIGPQFSSYAGLPRVRSFTRRLVERRDEKEMYWLNLPAFILLAHDLSLPSEESWPLVEQLLPLEHNRTIFNYPGWIVALRMFGKAAQDVLREIDVPGSYDLLEAMATK